MALCWRQIVARDAVIISEALQRGLFDPLLRKAFPSEEPAAEFSIGTEEQISATEAADLAGKLKVTGYTVDQGELEEATGYTLAPAPETTNDELRMMNGGGLALNKKAEATTIPNSSFILRNSEEPSSELLSAFAKDNSRLADAINLFLEDPSSEQAQDLIDALPDLVPDDPALASIIAEEMAKAVGGEIKNTGHPYTQCPACGKFMSPNGSCANCDFVEDDDRLIARGKKALSLATTGNQKSVKDAMYKKELGSIDFELGWEGKGKGMDGGSGILKLQQKHQRDLPHLPETIAKGRIVNAELTRHDPATGKKFGTGTIDENRKYIIDHPYLATLRKRADGTGWTVTSHYKSGEECIRYENRASAILALGPIREVEKRFYRVDDTQYDFHFDVVSRELIISKSPGSGILGWIRHHSSRGYGIDNWRKTCLLSAIDLRPLFQTTLQNAETALQNAPSKKDVR